MQELESTVAKLHCVVNELDRKNDDLENRARRNNLVIHGFPESPDENPEELTVLVAKMITDKLEVQCDNIERCHRVGSHNEGKIRPIILKILDFRTKANILKNAYKLKGSNTYINEDFSARVRKLRKLLWQHSADVRKNGRKIRLHRDCLVVDNVRYIWDDAKFAIVKAPQNVLSNSTGFSTGGVSGNVLGKSTGNPSAH